MVQACGKESLALGHGWGSLVSGEEVGSVHSESREP